MADVQFYRGGNSVKPKPHELRFDPVRGYGDPRMAFLSSIGPTIWTILADPTALPLYLVA
jgi:hypothetical protein